MQSFDRLELSIESEVPDTLFFGSALPLKLVAANAEAVHIKVAAASAADVAVFEENIPNETSGFVFNTVIAFPEVGELEEGNYIITASAMAGGKGTDEIRNIYLKEGEVLSEYYLVGGSSEAGWEPVNGIIFTHQTKTDDDGKVTEEWYDLFTYLTVQGDGFKILPSTEGWDGEISDNGENFTVEEDGFYRIRITPVADEAPTVELAKSQWGIIGDATPGGWDNDTDLTFTGSRGDYTWTGTFDLGKGEYKFRENDDWAVNLGGASEGLQYDGGNLKIETPGTYTVTLTLDPEKGYSTTIQ